MALLVSDDFKSRTPSLKQGLAAFLKYTFVVAFSLFIMNSLNTLTLGKTGDVRTVFYSVFNPRQQYIIPIKYRYLRSQSNSVSFYIKCHANINL